MAKFCKIGNAHVIPNAYNHMVEDPEKCPNKNKREICMHCVMFINASANKTR